MLAPRSLLACAALLLPAAACAAPFPGVNEFTVTAAGGRWSSGAPDPVVDPQLAAAWQAGAAPATPLIGRDHARWLRALIIAPTGEGPATARLAAQAIAPVAFTLNLYVERGGALAPLGTAASSAWNRGTHFARLELTRAVTDGEVLVLRAQSGARVAESRVRVRRAD